MNFEKTQAAIYSSIDKIGHKVNPNVGCFHDGAAFPQLYFESDKKIMWVLKNSYDDCDENGNPASDGMDVRDWFSDQALETASHKQIFIKMALSSYCIQNGLAYSEDLLCNKSLLMQSLKSIALVDLSKLPGGTSITDKDLKKEFSYFKKVFENQIALYEPDVIIFGNTLHICHHVFPGLNYKKPLAVYESNGNCLLRSFIDKSFKRVYLEAYHPSYPMSYEDYVGTIVNAALNSF